MDDACKSCFDQWSRLLTSWQAIGDKTYCFCASGVMQTGEAIIDGITHTFNDKGVLVG